MALIHRTKILLSVLQELGGRISDARLQQVLFLYCTEFVKRDEYYEFIPLQGLPYSVQAAEDKQILTRKKLLEKTDDWVLLHTGKRFAAELDFFEKIAIQDLKNTCQALTDEELVQRIGALYSPPSPHASAEPFFFTIGYEGISPEAYINALLANGVQLLVDVRRNAYSQKYGFSKAELSTILPRVGIEYLHMPELGIESEKRQNLETERDYAALFVEYERVTLAHEQASLDRLQRLLVEKSRIAITCFEADPHHCHRSRVAAALKARPDFTHKIEHLQPCQYHANHTAQNARKSL